MTPLCVLLTTAVLLFGASGSMVAQKAATSHNSSFAIAQQSTDAKGNTVVVLQGTGDLPGVLTLVLAVGPGGAISGGEWAMNVSYTMPLHPGALPDPMSKDADADSAIGETLVQKGVLSGSVGSGSVTMKNGLVSAIGSLHLVIARGTLQFAAVTQGSGSVVGTNIDSRASSAAYASLTF